jgi:hypothetical protein
MFNSQLFYSCRLGKIFTEYEKLILEYFGGAS